MASHRICSLEHCNNPHKAKGYCEKHYLRLRKHGDPMVCKNPIGKRPKVCSVDGCDSPHHALGYCGRHRAKVAKYGDPLAGTERTPKKDREKWIIEALSAESDDCRFYPYSNTPYTSVSTAHGLMSLHRWICILAHGEPPADRLVAAHKCGNGHLNCCNPRHLYWATFKQNERDKAAHGRTIRGEMQPRSKITVSDVREIRSLRGKMTQHQIAKQFGIDQTNVSLIQLRKAWAWVK